MSQVKQWKLRVDLSKRKYEFLELEANGMERARYDASDLSTIFDGTLVVFNHRDVLDGIDGEITYFPKDSLGMTPRIIINAENLSVSVVKNEGVIFAAGDYSEEMAVFAEEMFRIITGEMVYV